MLFRSGVIFPKQTSFCIFNPPIQKSSSPPLLPSVAVVGQEQGGGRVSAAQFADALDTVAPRKSKKCYRCGVAGHRSKECKVEICQICEGPTHGAKQCHLLTAPKPRILVYGYGHEDLILFKFPCTETYKPKMENLWLASLVVSGER